jgi:hypothetical protein
MHPSKKSPLNACASSPTEQDWLLVLAMGDFNCGQSPLGNGDARTTNIAVVVCICIRNLDRPAQAN